MLHISKKSFSAVAGLLLLPLLMRAQEGSYDMEFVKMTNPWLVSSNMSGLFLMPVDRISIAGAGFHKENGGLVSSDMSDDSYGAGVSTESFVKVSDKLSFYGKLSYDYFHGKNMGGSVFTDAFHSPLNIVEYSDTTAGVKNKEDYNIAGGLSLRLGKKWSIGVKADYLTGNYAKRKDPRFSNSVMNLDLGAGAAWQASDKFTAGINAIYTKKIEAVEAGIYGTTDKQYYSLVDYGGYFGTRELLNNLSGFLLLKSHRLLVNHYYGGSLQLDFSGNNDFFNEITVLYREGYYGKRTSTTPVFTEHGGMVFKYSGTFLIHGRRVLHRIGIDAGYETIGNDKNVFKENYVPGEGNKVEYGGKNEVLDRQDVNASVSYTGYAGTEGKLPVWEFGSAITLFNRTQTATVYPFCRDQDLLTYALDMNVYRNIIRGKNIYGLGLDVRLRSGSGTKNEDYAIASSTSSRPAVQDTYLDRDYEYRVSTGAVNRLIFKYMREFNKNIAGYVSLAGTADYLFSSPEYLPGRARSVLEITFGCVF